ARGSGCVWLLHSPPAPVVHCAGSRSKPVSCAVLLVPPPGRSGLVKTSFTVWFCSSLPVCPPSSTASFALTKIVSGICGGGESVGGGVTGVGGPPGARVC